MKKIVFALLLVAVVTTPALSKMMDTPMRDNPKGQAQMMGMGCMNGMGDMMDRCLMNMGEMGLTDAQIKKITPIHREMQKKQARFGADLKIAEIELQEILDVKDFDLEKATVAVKKIADIKTASHLEMLKSMKEVRAILTDEQFNKMRKMMPMMSGQHRMKKMMKK